MSRQLSEAAARLSAHFVAEEGEPPRADYEVVRDALQAFLLARFATLGPDELLDVADEALFRLFDESRRQGQALANPSSWLFTVAARLAIDRLRAAGKMAEGPDTQPDDDRLAGLLDEDASRWAVEAAFARAYAAGDHVCVRIVTVWLDLAAELGYAPSSREVAERVSYSHTTVNEALARLRRYLQDVRGE